MKYRYSIKTKFILLLTAVVLAFSAAAPVFAVEDTAAQETKKSEEKPSNPERKAGEKPLLGSGETGILIDAASGRILFESESQKRMYPASTTKIMTALLAFEAIERGELTLDTQVQVTAEMLKDSDPDGSNIALKEGEVMSMDNLLKGLMVASGNDAACAIAAQVGKSIPEFVNMMNSRAAELGCTDTHFVNPNGLHDDDHYTTAADMAKIARAAMSLEKFKKIADIAHLKIPPTNMTEKERYYINTNGLLSTMRYTTYYYKYATGIKTGHTSKAGNCLVASATRDGIDLIGVILGGAGVADSHKDNIEMFDWGFETYTYIRALQKGDMPCEVRVKLGKSTDSLTLSVAEAVNVIVPKGTAAENLEIRPNIPDSVSAPITAGTEIGSVSVFLNGEELGSGVLVASRDVERSFFWPVMAAADALWSNTVTRTIIFIILIGAAAFILLFIRGLYVNLQRAKRRKRRR
ncbi:MAG: D-alanyl-D-alanine carboxypeptidase family protein [Monoglobaceae bacterium]